MKLSELREFYCGKRVLVTGHTGFKGSWLCAVLSLCGTEVYGYSQKPPTKPSLFEVLYGEGAGDATQENLFIRQTASAAQEKAAGAEAGNSAAAAAGAGQQPLGLAVSHIGDIRDFDELLRFYKEVQPDCVFHLAAQPIVRDSYRIPRETYETNVMGTVNLLECLRLVPGCRSFLNVTTDKVYLNEERPGYGYREDDKLDGYDPYSNSKSCSELVTHSYVHSFFEQTAARGVQPKAGRTPEVAVKESLCGADGNAGGASAEGDAGMENACAVPAVSTARAGNVIGGGDFANDRIIPDCIRAAERGADIILRNPNSTRPYQHVLEPLAVYLTIVMRQAQRAEFAGWYNVGPDDCDCVTTGELADLFVRFWGEGIKWNCSGHQDGPHEANFLKLDNRKIKETFGWEPVWHIEQAVSAVVSWQKALRGGGAEAANAELLRQIGAYLSE